MSREAPRENTGSLDPGTQPDDAYVHPQHERAAQALGFRRLRTGTLMELEAKRRGMEKPISTGENQGYQDNQGSKRNQ